MRAGERSEALEVGHRVDVVGEPGEVELDDREMERVRVRPEPRRAPAAVEAANTPGAGNASAFVVPS